MQFTKHIILLILILLLIPGTGLFANSPVNGKKPKIRYYRKWNIRSGELTEAVKRISYKDKYYKVLFFDSDKPQKIIEIRRGEKVWTFKNLDWEENNLTKFTLEFHQRIPITSYDSHLFAPDLSEMRPGWQANFVMNKKIHRPAEVTIRDSNDILYYFYNFDHQMEKSTNRRMIISKYFRADSSLVGYHELYYTKEVGLEEMRYFDARGKRIKSLDYSLDRMREELTITTKDSSGQVLERRIVPRPLGRKP